MIEIKNLEGISFEQIYTAFKSAFSDYEISVDKIELKSMLKRRGFNPALSFGAFYEDNIVAFTFNGIGKYYNGKLTAYDTGTGTRKEFRGQGLAKRIFTHSMPFLKELIERLTATAAEITHIPAQFFTVTIKELPDENFGIGGKSIDEIKRNYKS